MSKKHQPLGRNKVRKDLKRLEQKIPWGDDDGIKEIALRLFEEEPRGLIILAGSVLESHIDQSLVNQMGHLSREERDNLFEYEAPLGRFSWKLRVAHAMGVIQKDTYHKIDFIKDMRNVAAHTLSPIDFSVPEIQQGVEWLMKGVPFGRDFEKTDVTYRREFLAIVTMLMAIIKTGDINSGWQVFYAAIKASK